MKKIYLSLGTFLLCSSLIAQVPASRTAATIAADVLSQMPAERQAEYNKLIAELSQGGEEAVLGLVRMIHAPGQGSNEQVEYALSGLSQYVMMDGKESARSVVANAYIKGLSSVSERETKAFLIRQLQIAGKDESVETLASYLSDESLSGPAARALASIARPKAIGALENALSANLPVVSLNNVILAIAESNAGAQPGIESKLWSFATSQDENTSKMAYYAISEVGGTASVKRLAEAAERVGYKGENRSVNDAYIRLLTNLVKRGDVKEAEKAANDLLKKATKSGETHTRTAALEIILSVQKNAGTKTVLTALKDPSKEYRNAALDFLSPFADRATYVELVKTMAKAKPEVKVDILNWLGREATSPEKNSILKNLEIRFDLPAKQVLTDQLKANEFEVKQAAVWAIVRIGDESMIPVLAGLLTDNDKQVVLLAQDGLMAFRGNISSSVAKVIPNAPDAGQIAATELLASRKSSANLNTVMELLKSNSPEVKAAVYTSLKDLVTERDMTRVCGMLETSEESAVAPLQQAVIASLAGKSSSEQIAEISRRMVQAGEGKKYLYYQVLAATGEKEALATIINGFSTGSAAVRESAFEALLSWKGPEAADELYAIASNPAASAYHERALTAYIRLVSNPSITGENRLIGLRKAMEISRKDEQKVTILRQIQRTGTFLGMLYAGQFLDQKPLQEAAAQAVMNIALSHPEYYGTNVKELLNKVIPVLNNPDADYQRQAIRKFIDEMPDEEGYVSIFNGKDLTGWKGLVENPIARSKMSAAQLAKAQVKADEQMRKDWSVQDGLLVFDGTGYDNICTVKQYGDIEMYVDWLLDPDGPEPDAGIYLRGTPQVQVWDTSRVKVGAQVGSGGLYNNRVHESKPLKVADNKLGEWNSFYIKMVGDRVTVKLNGELVTDDVILENFWDRSQPIPPIEQLELQAHGCKVYYRDIYVKELPRPEPFRLSAEEEKEGYRILFDGTNMHQWTGNMVDYTLEDGTISMIPTKSFGGNLYTKEEFGNFIIRFEFELTPAANNGLGIRTPMEGDAAYVGMELQILDNEHPVYRELEDYQYHGSVYGIIPAKRGYLKPVGEWNYQEVIANGDHIKITLNGEVILDGNIREAVKNGTPDGKEHPGLFNAKGHIAFLGHGSPVKFRNIRIKELK